MFWSATKSTSDTTEHTWQHSHISFFPSFLLSLFLSSFPSRIRWKTSIFVPTSPPHFKLVFFPTSHQPLRIRTSRKYHGTLPLPRPTVSYWAFVHLCLKTFATHLSQPLNLQFGEHCIEKKSNFWDGLFFFSALTCLDMSVMGGYFENTSTPLSMRTTQVHLIRPRYSDSASLELHNALFSQQLNPSGKFDLFGGRNSGCMAHAHSRPFGGNATAIKQMLDETTVIPIQTTHNNITDTWQSRKYNRSYSNH